MLIEEIAQYLDIQGQGKYDAVGDTGNIFLGVIPSTPNNLVSIFLRDGGEADPFNEYVEANIQIIVRSDSKIGGMEHAQAILRLLNGHDDAFVTGGTTIIDCLARQAEPVDIGKDDAGLFEWSINLMVYYYNK